MKTNKSGGYFLVPLVVVAKRAFHSLDPKKSIFRSPTLCIVDAEDGRNYFGYYPGAPGLLNLRIPKSTTCRLTPRERKKIEAIRISEPPRFHPELFQLTKFGSKLAPIIRPASLKPEFLKKIRQQVAKRRMKKPKSEYWKSLTAPRPNGGFTAGT